MFLPVFPMLYFLNKRIHLLLEPSGGKSRVQTCSFLSPDQTELGIPSRTWVSGLRETRQCLRASQLLSACGFQNKPWKVISSASPFTYMHFFAAWPPEHPAPHTQPTHLMRSLLHQGSATGGHRIMAGM